MILRTLDPDQPHELPCDPFTLFVENETSIGHLRARGLPEERLREIRQEMDTSLMELHRHYRALGVKQGFNPIELYGWGTESFYSATSPSPLY